MENQGREQVRSGAHGQGHRPSLWPGAARPQQWRQGEVPVRMTGRGEASAGYGLGDPRSGQPRPWSPPGASLPPALCPDKAQVPLSIQQHLSSVPSTGCTTRQARLPPPTSKPHLIPLAWQVRLPWGCHCLPPMLSAPWWLCPGAILLCSRCSVSCHSCGGGHGGCWRAVGQKQEAALARPPRFLHHRLHVPGPEASGRRQVRPCPLRT